MLRILHTADWHLGHVSGQLEEADARKLARARLQVLDKVLGVADQFAVDAVVCAGDLFDDPTPADELWRGLAKKLERQTRPVVLLPGNNDPLTPTSVWAPGHPFRQALPASVHVVDKDGFALSIASDAAVVLATPCRSRAGERDPALALPAREPGDRRVRIGLVHGSTFDAPDHATNFPIARDAGLRRGLDYLAVGDTHAFRDATPDSPCPTVYPGSPEPTGFKEKGGGTVALVTFHPGARPEVRPIPVASWTWREETVRDLDGLRRLLGEELARTVLRLVLDLEVSLPERDELEALLLRLSSSGATHGQAGALRLVRKRVALRIGADAFPEDLSPALTATVAELERQAKATPEPGGVDPEVARRALLHLHRLVREEA